MTQGPDEAAQAGRSPFDDVNMEPGQDLVAVGAELSPHLVLDAYRHGVFPWYEEGSPVLWWSPDPRAVLPLDALACSPAGCGARAGGMSTRFDTTTTSKASCERATRTGPDGTWIHEAMVACYTELHALGHAHSVEIRQDDRLIGGIYGVAFGGGFAAESMFHRVRDASKLAFVHLVEHLRARGFVLLDVQFLTDHLEQFGCEEIERDEYLELVREARSLDVGFA